jgi:hypothetical protein
VPAFVWRAGEIREVLIGIIPARIQDSDFHSDGRVPREDFRMFMRD